MATYRTYRGRNAWLAGEVLETFEAATLAAAKRQAAVAATHISLPDGTTFYRVAGTWLRA
jgi:hypothetical protein